MAVFESARAVTGIAAIDLSTFVYHFGVWTTTAGEFTSGTTTLSAQGRVDGIVGEGVVADERLNVIVPDGAFVKVKAGATIAALDLIATAADGRAIEVGASNGDQIWGIAMTAGAANDIITIQFGFKGQINA